MNLKACRIWLVVLLFAVAVAGVVFYERQNADAQIGGSISLPKMLWLAYAVTAWFLVPPILWLDRRLHHSVRLLFGAFWLAMMVRGIIELEMLYAIGHWHPLYGIAHNGFCILLLLFFLRRSKSVTDLSSSARRYGGSLVLSLVVESAFAFMFMQTGAHESATYFASADPSWTLVNYITWAALAFFYPDLVATLALLYFPGISIPLSRLLAWTRVAAAAAAVIVVLAGSAAWTWIMQVESEAKRFQSVGYEIVESCSLFKDDFLRGDTAAMTDFSGTSEVSWRAGQFDPARRADVDVERWSSDGPTRPLHTVLAEWRRHRKVVHQAAFKIHLLDDVISDHEAVAQIRFEVTGPRFTDNGLLRCGFERGFDQRWRVTHCSLIEGTTVAGTAQHFVDRAEQSGVGFVIQPDRRFVPGDRCTDHKCFGPTELRFEMMRFAYAGCSAADYDGDGFDDVFFCSGGRPALFRNRGDGTFHEVTSLAGLGIFGTSTSRVLPTWTTMAIRIYS